jgi:hypothetical protein
MHGVAGWWSRALTQQAAQSSSQWEAFSFETLLAELLTMNEIVLTASSRTAWACGGQEKWSGISDRARRYERDLDLQAEMQNFTYDDRRRLHDDAKATRDKGQTAKAVKKELAKRERVKAKAGGTSSFVSAVLSFASTAEFHQTTRKKNMTKGGEPPSRGGKKGSGYKGGSEVKREWLIAGSPEDVQSSASESDEDLPLEIDPTLPLHNARDPKEHASLAQALARS